MEKSDRLSLEITDVTEDGRGIGRADDGMTVFVRRNRRGAMALPGDLVTAEIRNVKKRFAEATLISVDRLSEYRLPEEAETCPYIATCGGCAYGLLNYDAQCQLKQRRVSDVLEHITGTSDVEIEPILRFEDQGHYRNKAVMAVSADPSGKPAVGFFRGRSHYVFDCRDCGIQAGPAAACARALRGWMADNRVCPYDYNKKGEIRSMTVRTAFGTGDVMVIIVTAGQELKNPEDLVERLAGEIEALDGGYGLVSVHVNQNRGSVNEIYGKKSYCLAGEETIDERMRVETPEGEGELVFEITPYSFYQVNPVMTEKLYAKVAEYAGTKAGETLLDLYCGAGAIGLYLNAAAGGGLDVVGVESNPQAVLNANRNAVRNGVIRARYVLGKAEEILPELLKGDFRIAKGGKIRPIEETEAEFPEKDDLNVLRIRQADAVILDPPRAGCGRDLLEAAAAASPGRIVYVSCEPATLARDLKVLAARGYRLVKACPVDMFPETGRVECVTLLRKSQGHHTGSLTFDA